MLFSKKLTESNLVGVWKHPILASQFRINGGATRSIYNDEIFVLRADGTFTFGEYSSNGPLYESKGTWRTSDDRKWLVFSFPGGETSSMDIRNFDGRSFVTTSREGNKFKYTKQ